MSIIIFFIIIIIIIIIIDIMEIKSQELTIAARGHW